MRQMGEISRKFKPPDNRTIKKDVKTVLLRSPFIDKTNMLQVPSNINKDVSKVVQKRKETRNKENFNDVKRTQVKSKIKLDDNKLQHELRINVNNILPRNNVPECTKKMEVTGMSVTINKENAFFRGAHNTSLAKSHTEAIQSTKTRDENIVKDPKFNLRCVVQLKKSDINKPCKKSSNDVKNTVQKAQFNVNKVIRKNNSISAYKSNETPGEVLHADRQLVSSKAVNEEKSKIIPIINRSTSPKYLRKRSKKNYAEMSLDKSQELPLPNSVSSKKVPIYRNQQGEEGKTMGRTDVYEFDEIDSGKVQKRKNINKSERFDKSMYNILQKIEMKEAKLQAKNKRKITKGVGRSRKRNEPLQGIRKKEVRKVVIAAKPDNENHGGNIVKCNTSVRTVENMLEHKNLPENKNYRVKCSKNIQNVENMPEHEIQIPDINTNVPEDDSDDDNEEFFGFGEVQHSTPVKINPKVNIISDITLKEIDGSDLFNNLKPNANSTMLPLPSDKRSPWRFDQNLKRNPHFIALKHTALPCLQQDMVLDYVQLEKSAHFSNSKKTTETTKKKLAQSETIETPKKKLVQKSITDFMIVSPGRIIDKENIPHSSLFDYDEFSPKKIKSSRDISKSNAKRNILGPRRDNLENIQVNDILTRVKTIPLEKSLSRMNENDDVDTYFGFDDDREVVLPENKSISKNNAQRSILGPTQDNLENIQVRDKTIASTKSLTNMNEDNDVDTYFGFDDDYEVALPENKNISNNNAKRNTLGTKQDNLEQFQASDVSTRGKTTPSEKSLIETDEDNDIDTYFGFDDDSEMFVPEIESRASDARPYRINRIVRKKRAKEVTETELTGRDLTDLQESHGYQPEEDGKEVGLFDDPEQVISLNVPSKIYERKRRRRRLVSVDVDEEESHPKKKNMMTKKEEDDFEKWAARFNSECEEIEKYDLEIE